MARRKETISQNDFSFGAVREEAVERDDTDILTRSVKEAVNTITLTSGQIEERPGTEHLSLTLAKEGFECDLGSGDVFELCIFSGGFALYDEDGNLEYGKVFSWISTPGIFGSPSFEDMAFWVIADPDAKSILIGNRYIPIHALVLEDGVWSFGEAAFPTGIGEAIGQPYWRYHRDVSIQPSDISGTITVRASEPIWTEAHRGTRIRYVDREIELGARISATEINGTVIEELPDTFTITISDASEYEIGEAVEDYTRGGQGIVVGRDTATNQVTVLATGNFNEFASGNDLVGPNAKQAMTAISSATNKAETFIWDMQMLSPAYGYPNYAARHQQRMFLCQFPKAPQAFAVSAAGEVLDFTMGENDDDAFVEIIGADRGGELRYIVSAEDLMFFTTRGVFYQSTRDGTPITPRSINPVQLTRIGCADVRPVAVDDGAVFVDSVGRQIYAVVLAGDVNRSWQAQSLTRYHGEVSTDPIYLGATSAGSERPEGFVYAVNSDGTVAVCQWERFNDVISWRPWTTRGNFVALYQVFGHTHCIVDREVNGATVRFRERLSYDTYLDCVSDAATHLIGETATSYVGGWDVGDYEIGAGGLPVDEYGVAVALPASSEVPQIGFPISVDIVPWPRRSARTSRGTRDVKRLIDLYVTVHNSSAFKIAGDDFGGYDGDDDLTAPPPLRSEEFRQEYSGGDPFEELHITKDRPGPFRLLKLKYRVTI